MKKYNLRSHEPSRKWNFVIRRWGGDGRNAQIAAVPVLADISQFDPKGSFRHTDGDLQTAGGG